MDSLTSQGLRSDISFPNGQGDPDHQNFIHFLQIAISLNVGLLPLAWDPAFEALGSGATGVVKQSQLNAETWIAFKRFEVESAYPGVHDEEFRNRQYGALISELNILGHREIRRHPNIISLVGVCFEIIPRSNVAVPVLALAKAHHADLVISLYEMPRLVGLPRDSFPLLAICGEIAKGLEILHQSGIAHCDLKPANVLVVKDQYLPDVIQIKIADFASACFGASEDEPVKVSRTEPWDAPEWHPRYFLLKDAKKMDIYAFGLLCLWLFFRHDNMNELGPGITVGMAFSGQDPGLTAKLQALKRDGDAMLDCAFRLTNQSRDIEEDARDFLLKALPLALQSDPNKRQPTIEAFVSLLCTGERLNEQLSPGSKVSEPAWHGTLQIKNIYHELESGDFRICAYIVQSLVEMAEGRGCDLCRNNAAFQLAVCYSFGFGVLGDDSIVKRWLDLSGRPWADLRDVLQWMKDHSSTVPIISDLREKGFPNEIADRYSQDGILSNALELYRAMVNCRETVFGPGHSSTLRIRSILIDLLRWNDEFEDAMALALENIHHTSLGEVPLVDHLASKTKLARTYFEIGKIDLAEQIQSEVLTGYTNSSRKDHTFRLTAQVFLAEILEYKGMFKEAIELSQEAERKCSLALGDLHSWYTNAIRVLALAYDGRGDLENAIIKGEHVRLLSQRSLSKDHPLLIQDITRLGIRYYRHQNYERARECYQTIQEAIQRKPANAIPAVIAATASAMAIYQTSRADEASKILEALLPEAKRVLGGADKCVVSVMRALGKIYYEKKTYGEADTILRQVLEADPLVRGRLSKPALLAATTLAQCIAFQGRWMESAQRDMETLLVAQNTPYLTESDEIGIIMRAARSFTYAKAWAEAIPLLERGTLWGKSQEEGKPIKYLCALALTGICYWRLGQPKRSLELVREILDGLQTPFEEDPDELISCLVSLGKRCMENSSFAEAGQLLGGSMLLASQLPGVSQHVKQMVNGAISGFLVQGRPEEELEFNPSVLSNADEQN